MAEDRNFQTNYLEGVSKFQGLRTRAFLQEMMSTVLVQRIQGKARTSVEEDIDQLLDLFLNGARQHREG